MTDSRNKRAGATAEKQSLHKRDEVHTNGVSVPLPPARRRKQCAGFDKSTSLDYSELSFHSLHPAPVPPVRTKSLKRGQIGALQHVEMNGEKSHACNSMLRRAQSEHFGRGEAREMTLKIATNQSSEMVFSSPGSSLNRPYTNAPLKPPRTTRNTHVSTKPVTKPEVTKTIVSRHHFSPILLRVITFCILSFQFSFSFPHSMVCLALVTCSLFRRT